MLRRLIPLLVVCVGVAIVPPAGAFADDGGGIVVTPSDPGGAYNPPAVKVGVADPGGRRGSGLVDRTGEGGGLGCRWRPVPEMEAWVRRLPTTLPAAGPDRIDPRSRLYARTCNGVESGFAWFGGAVPSAVAATPGELAREAYGELRLPAPLPGRSPDLRLAGGRAGLLVGEHTWLWTSGSAFSVRSRTVRAGAVWARVTAWPVGLSFDPGTGDPVVDCVGPGTAFVPGRYVVHAASPTCDVVLTRSSARFAGGVVMAVWAVRWRVSWVGAAGGRGESGVLADMISRTPVVLAVAEAQALVTG
jgi:hypothetical protein